MDNDMRPQLSRALALSTLSVAMTVALAGAGAADPGQVLAPVREHRLTVDTALSPPPFDPSHSVATEVAPIPAPMPDPIPEITQDILHAITSLAEELTGFIGQFLLTALWLRAGR
ncbi:hypothetical protein [Nocardia abscessus]|uniref:hypothetical protein n=1 Tax=Nocardia abscessus TaxID=120957 RepID=UPI0024543AC7|nr:hypothetical protein [Nocardia abscessus]